MKKLLICLSVLGLIFGVRDLTMAGSTAQQTIGFGVDRIREISVSGNPPTLKVNTSTGGQQPDEVSDSSTTYNITFTMRHNGPRGMHLCVELEDEDMPPYTRLKVNLAAPPGATSTGDVTLRLWECLEAVSGVWSVVGANLPITYKFYASPQAGEVSGTRTIFFYIYGGSIY
jgi:hypothetical protein